MKATEIIKQLRDNDFEIKADGEYLELSPAGKVTEELIQRLQKHKPEILKELQAEANNNDARQIETAINPFTHEASTHEVIYLFGDDRVLCRDCNNLNWQGRCAKWRLTNPEQPRYSPVQDVAGRCDQKGL